MGLEAPYPAEQRGTGEWVGWGVRPPGGKIKEVGPDAAGTPRLATGVRPCGRREEEEEEKTLAKEDCCERNPEKREMPGFGG